MESKTCSRCKENLPINNFIKDKYCKDGFRNICRECRLNNERTTEPQKCSICKIIKPSEDYSSNKKRKNGLNLYCKECYAEYRKTKPSHNKKYRRFSYERTTEPQKCKICNQIKDASEYAKAKENLNGIRTFCKSCGYKLQKEYKSKNIQNFMKNLYKEAKSNSKRRIKQKEFTISFDEWMSIYNKQDGKCALTGVDMTYTYNDKERDKKVMNRNNISPDRIDSDKGYTKDNIQFVCVEINIAKQEHTNTEFIEMCRRVANFNTPT